MRIRLLAEFFLIVLSAMSSSAGAKDQPLSVSPISHLNPCETGFMNPEKVLSEYLRSAGVADSDLERLNQLRKEPEARSDREHILSLQRKIRDQATVLSNRELREVLERLPLFVQRLGTSSWLARVTYGDVWTRGLFDALITWAPFWIADPESHQVCDNLIRETYMQDLGKVFAWCMKAMPGRFHSSFITMFRDRIADARYWSSAEESDWYIQLLSFFSPEDVALLVPPTDRPTWFASEYHLSQILKSDNVETIWLGKARCGRCVNMFGQHTSGLGLTSPSKGTPSILIMVDGKLVGALKLEGDHSLLALRNVMDREGRLVLVEGAVYGVSKSLRRAALSTRGESNQFIAVDFPQLEAFPRALVMNENARFHELEDWFTALGGQMEREEISKLKYYYTRKLKQVAWKHLLDNLRKRRSDLENQIRQGQIPSRQIE